jgi:hypothetical protein
LVAQKKGGCGSCKGFLEPNFYISRRKKKVEATFRLIVRRIDSW